MNYNESYEETIDLLDLCICILKKWRILLLAVVLGAAVLGGYKAARGLEPGSVSAADQKAAEEAIKTLKNQEAAWLSQNKETIKNAESTLENNKAQIVSTTQQIQTREDKIERLETLLPVWEQELEEVRRWAEEADTVEGRAAVAEQLVSLNNNILSVQNQISAAQTEIVNYQAEIVRLEKSNKDLEASLKKAQTDEFVPDAALVAQSNPVPTGAEGNGAIVKFAVLGAFLGAFCVCGVIFLQYIFYKKLRGADELRERFGVRVLGSLYMPDGKKNAAVDRLLDKLSGEGQPVDAAKEYDLIAAGLQVMSREQTGTQPKRIMVTGTVSGDTLQEICAQLQKLLPENQYQLWAAENPAYNAQALRQIREGEILLVEAKGGSEKKEIGKLIELLNAGKAQVIGAVIV